jgi:hypothetical protein
MITIKWTWHSSRQRDAEEGIWHIITQERTSYAILEENQICNRTYQIEVCNLRQ